MIVDRGGAWPAWPAGLPGRAGAARRDTRTLRKTKQKTKTNAESGAAQNPNPNQMYFWRALLKPLYRKLRYNTSFAGLKMTLKNFSK